MNEQIKIKGILTPGKVISVTMIMCVVLVAVVIASLVLGTADVSLKQVMGLITGAVTRDDPVWLIIYKIRLPE